MSEPNATNVSNGPALLFFAPSGTAFPSLTTAPTAVSFLAAGFKQAGYSDTGVEIVTTPSTKEITPDEEITPVKIIVTGVKAEIKFTMLEAQLENLQVAAALTSLSNPGTGIKTLGLGSGNPLKEFAVGIIGSGPGGAGNRVTAVWRVISETAVTEHRTMKDVIKYALTLRALADSTQASSENVYKTIDYNAGS